MANRFWVGGTGTWDNVTTTHWSASTGGAGGASVPAAVDLVTFDGASGGGTVTVAATINASNTLSSITMGAFTGTLDFSANNPSITLTGNGFSNNGTGTRTLNMGSGTFTLTGGSTTVWDCGTITGLTFNAGTSNIVIAPGGFPNSTSIAFNTLTYATVTLGPSGAVSLGVSGACTIGTLNIIGPIRTAVVNGTTISTALSIQGTSTSPVVWTNNTPTTVSSVTLSAPGATASWCALSGITFVTNSLTATNSWNMGSVTNATITNPSTTGGGIIGS
jgi:hypothetical protein